MTNSNIKSKVAMALKSHLNSGEYSSNIKRSNIIQIATSAGGTEKDAWTYLKNHHKDTSVGVRGYYSVRAILSTVAEILGEPITDVGQIAAVEAPAATISNINKINYHGVASVTDDEVYIPSQVPEYIKWGEFSNIEKIVKSKMFYPIYISGPSGNGKTMMVEQVCAKTKREYVRVQISPETDEDDLIGGFRLIDGETVFQKGPVIKAMERGCILLIDEIDRATNKIMCLQGVLEGNPVLLKKTGEVVLPATGFNVIATANTKGRGSDDGRYSAASIIDDAFLERFVAAIDQPFPAAHIEEKIVKAHMVKYDCMDNEFLKKLVGWSNVIRKTFEADGVDEVVSTRRLCHIVKTFKIFNDRMQSINMCISRFDEETKEAFLDLYSKIDENVESVNVGDEAHMTDENPLQSLYE